MLKTSKKILSVLMVVLLVLTAVPLSSFVGIELPDFDLGIRASAKTEGYYTYEVFDNKATITDVDTSISGDITIPSMLGGYSVTAIGDRAFSSCSLTSVTIPYSVTTIGMQAFAYCKLLTNITISNSVTTIGTYAFMLCESLISITIPDSVTNISYNAFDSCYSLAGISVDENNKNYSSDEYGVLFNKDKTMLIRHPIGSTRNNYVVPDGVTNIGKDAFSGCTSLTSITIPDSVTSIGAWAFEGCSSLISMTIPDSVKSIDNYVFTNCKSLTSIIVDENNNNYSSDEYGVLFNKDKTILIKYPVGNTRDSYVIPDCVMSISNSAFSYCISLTSVTISNNVTNIGNGAFSYCSSLTSITIPDNVTSIGSNTFSECKSLVSVIIPNSVTSIGEQAFYYCIALTSVTIPDSVTNIGYIAFMNCISLASITIPHSVTSIGDKSFYGCRSLMSINVDENNKYYSSDENGVLYNKNKTTLIQYTCGSTRDSYVIPDGVINIGNGAFEGSKSLKSVTITDGVISIGNDAFNYCYRLTNITIPDSVTSIGSYAFYSCSLKNIIIPNSVTSIGNGAFCYCSSLEKVTIPDSVTSIGEKAFYGCRDLESITLNNPYCNIYNSGDTIYSDATIYGCCNSTAQAYAENYNRNFVAEHNYSAQITVPTCTEQGYITYTCECGDTYKDDYVDKLGHSFTNYISDGKATCVTDGSLVAKCDNCDELDSVPEKGGHKFSSSFSIDIDPTCTNEGQKSRHCVNCPEKTDIASIGKLAHKYSSVVTNSTCTAKGYTTFTCECGDTYKADYVNENGHKYKSEITTPATHLTDGVETFTCHCGDSYTKSVPNTEEHKYNLLVTDPTCTAKGYTTFTCECGDSYVSDYVDMLPHTYNITTIVPDCTNKGYKVYTCACGDNYADTIPANGHTESEWIIDANSTCVNEGSKHIECTICEETIKTQLIEKLPHNYKTVVTAPTCEDPGYTTYICECGYTYTDDSTPATGHSYNNGVCSNCGDDKTKDCFCNCHKSGIAKIIFKIILIFQKIFKTNKVCSCGVNHY